MSELYITNILKSLFFPPGGLLLLLLIGILLLRYNERLAKALLWSCLVIAYVISTPFVSGLLLSSLEDYPALSAADIAGADAQAIVILSAGSYPDAPEYGEDTVGDRTLVRIRYGAYLYHQTHLPVLVSGGQVFPHHDATLAAEMARVLSREFGVARVWQEGQSRNTAENARYSKKILAARGIDTIFLVTHASDMPRAVSIFEKQGLNVIPAPTRLDHATAGPWLFALLPSAAALQDSYTAIYEWVGRAWYRLRY
jgi:uncharacterized SAM-binding protein YcdF (DUF218 family)